MASVGRMAVDAPAADATAPQRRARTATASRVVRDPYALAVAAITLAALGLRLPGVSQSVVGDELYLYEIVRRGHLFDVIEVVRETESTPPLHFVVAWAAAKLGDPLLWIRVPSLVFGTLTVPLVYVLGRRAVGRVGAVIAAALMALAPLAIFYSDDARAYAMLAFLTCLSALLLLRALDENRPAWWVAFAACCTAALYVHYMALFVLAAEAAWAAWSRRDRLQPLAYACAGVAVAYLPWLPSFFVQREDSSADRIEALYPLDADAAVRIVLQTFPGLQFVPLRDLPGVPALALLGVAVGVAAFVVLARRRPDVRALLASRAGLMVVLALVTPVLALLYSLGPESVFLPRNLIPSLPFACLALGALFAALDRPLFVPVAGLAIVAVAIGAARTFDPDVQRSPYEHVAGYLEEHARPADTIVEAVLATGPPGRALRNYLDPGADLFLVGLDERRRNPRAGPEARLFVVLPQYGRFLDPGGAPRPRGFRRVSEARFRGNPAIEVYAFRAVRPGASR